MEKTFDFEQVGKRMPYSVPEGFFDKLEENVVASLSATATSKKSKKAHTVKIAVRSALALAATVALFFIVKGAFFKSVPQNDFASVELAFNNLSTDDQDFLIDIYEEEDLFINDFDNP